MQENPDGSRGLIPRPYNILVVEDDDTTQKMIQMMLKHAGYQVSVAFNGREALARITELSPDLIISDIMMPGMDGISLLTHLRSFDSTRSIPLILVTSKGTTTNIVEGLQLGADDYLVKPFAMPELLARVRSKLERPPIPGDLLHRDRLTGLLVERVFQEELDREFLRAKRSGSNGCLVYLSLVEWAKLREKFGARAEAEVASQLADILAENLQPLDLAGRTGATNFCLLLPETTPEAAGERLQQIAQKIVRHDFFAAREHLHLTPAFGFSTFKDAQNIQELKVQVAFSLDLAESNIDLQPKRYSNEFASKPKEKGPAAEVASQMVRQRRQSLGNLPWQIGLSLILGLVIPYFIYVWLDSVGHDITRVVYILLVISLALTALLIWIEGFYSLKKTDPSEELKIPYPTATAIIAAYLPNEALTILDTVQAFLRLKYPAELQIILAYNTPTNMLVETALREIARRDPRFLLLRVPNSNSKAQNLNAALSEVRGEFVGIFDADHHPMPDSFVRAWRWLAQGFGVVQGHCVIRNGETNWISRLVAVEFEQIYGSSHPGRMRLYQFGIFGGSNGYWRTSLLRETRMHGFMLTEDIDSSMRIIGDKNRILSDPQLLSYELAPASIKDLWNQRMRWAQGWYQVSKEHFWKAIRSNRFTLRQKFGLFWLLGWREIYPWISMQIYPLIAFWVVKYGGLQKINWLIPIFVLTTLFTLSVGPGQAIFAYLVSTYEIKKHKGWFVFYLIMTSLFYSEFKNLIARVAQIKELFGERDWRVTPRETEKPSTS